MDTKLIPNPTEDVNTAPIIESDPSDAANVGKLYTYLMVVHDNSQTLNLGMQIYLRMAFGRIFLH